MSGFHRYYVDMAHIFFVKIRKHVPLILGLVIGFLAFWKWPGGLIAGAIFAVVAYVATRVIMFPKPGSPAIRRIGPGTNPAALEGTGVDAKELDDAIRNGKADCNSLQNLAFRITRPEVRRKVEGIADVAYRIVEDVKKDPKDLRAARQFFGYYLGACVKVVSSYVELSVRPVQDDETKAACAKVEAELDTIRQAFEKQLATLQENNLIDLDVELSVLKNTIRMEGLGGGGPTESPKTLGGESKPANGTLPKT